MMLTPCCPSAGPTGGAGVAAPASICSLMIAASFFLGGISGFLDLGDLAEGELDRRLTTEDRDQYLQLLRVRIDFIDGRGQRRERAVHDSDRLADLVVDDLRNLGFLFLFGLRREDARDLIEGERRGAAALPDETGDAGGVPYGGPRLV